MENFLISNTFLISDTHFGHANILTFKKEDGTLLRPDFKDIQEHDLKLMENWNSIVGKNDKVYHLGDIGFINFTHIQRIFNNLNGTKILIKGNHDKFKLSQYAQIFKDVRATHVLDKFVLSHVPIHPFSLDRWKANIHGHLHEHKIEDEKYINVCVEHINYAPIDFEEIKRR